jgi:hypothetical protein
MVMAKDRFDFEQEIMHCWSVTEDIKAFAAREDITTEQWLALAQVYEVKFNVLFDHFEAMIKSGQIE